jgi:hypothetical protein
MEGFRERYTPRCREGYLFLYVAPHIMSRTCGVLASVLVWGEPLYATEDACIPRCESAKPTIIARRVPFSTAKRNRTYT